MKKINSQSGFTLVEILIASFIFATVIVIAVGIFTITSNTQISSENMRNVAQNGTNILEVISRSVRMADTFQFCNNISGENGTDCVDPGIQGNYLRLVSGNTVTIYAFYPTDKQLKQKSSSENDFQSLLNNFVQIEQDENNPVFSGYYPSQSSTKQPEISIDFKISIKPEFVKKQSENVTQTIKTSIATRAYGSVGSWIQPQ